VFFLQEEDGIRYRNVTGVQTCALPIYRGRDPVSSETSLRATARSVPATDARYRPPAPRPRRGWGWTARRSASRGPRRRPGATQRSEERRVGKECRGLSRLYDRKKERGI